MRVSSEQNHLPSPHVLLAFVGLNVMDLLSTTLGVRLGLSEMNVIPSILLSLGGTYALYAFKALTVIAVVGVVLRLGPNYPRLWKVLWLANCLLGVVVASNLVQTLAYMAVIG